jgi:flagellar biosynthesis/type III secretory pathway protein FliH
MDGSGSSFLFDMPHLSGPARAVAAGILYIEDFDAEPIEQIDPASVEPPLPEPPALTPDDLEAAREAGRAEGMQSALSDAALIQSQVFAACMQSLADAIGGAHTMLERLAREQAEDGARTMLAILQAAVPATLARHGMRETNAMVQALLPGLICEPELRVRTHPDFADVVRETLIGLLDREDTVLSVSADATLAAGDVRIAWLDGHAQRDTGAIWNDIRAALAPLGLPAIEEICCGNRS